MLIDGTYYIPTDALALNIEKVTLKDNRLFLVMDGRGEVPRILGKELGFYVSDTRYLDVWELSLNGELLTLLAAERHSFSNCHVFVLTNRDIRNVDGSVLIARDHLKIKKTITLANDQILETLLITNYDQQSHAIQLERRVGSDFDDIFEVRGMIRKERGQIHRPEIHGKHEVALRYEGLDGRRYQTFVYFREPFSLHSLDGEDVLLKQQLDLPPKQTIELQYLISCGAPLPKPFGCHDRGEKKHKADGESVDIFPKILTSQANITQAFTVAENDIRTLLTHRNGYWYPDAGIPWFCAPFGRDGIITAYQLLPWNPLIAQNVLGYLFSHLGQKQDSFTDEEPGKVFHEFREGEMARCREVPFIPYYGTVDATPLALILFCEYLRWTDDREFALKYWNHARQAAGWLLYRMEIDPQGFISYRRGDTRGLINQGWKDSHDGIMHASGALAEPPISLCEVQAYAYRALNELSRVASRMDDNANAARYQIAAAGLGERFSAKFWDPDDAYVYLALDAGGRPCRVKSSNQGHCLWAGILDPDQAAAVSACLLSDDLFSGFGIRTLSQAERSYNPLSYHNGSIWPHDNSLIAEGMRRYQLYDDLRKLCGAIFSVVEKSQDARLPELYCGLSFGESDQPVPYDVACKPQAWAAGSLYLLLKSLLGLEVNATDGSLIFRHPILCNDIREIVIRGLRFRHHTLDLNASAGTYAATLEVLHKSPGLRVATYS